MAPKTIQYGPKLVRSQVIGLDKIDSETSATGWRDLNTKRIDELTDLFLGGSYGLGVTCGVQILEKENSHGQKVIDDGVSTVAALKACAATYATNNELTPNKEVWSESLATIFRNGLPVRVVAYKDDDDREAREAWNTAKHDEDNASVRWSTLHQKLTVVVNRFKKHGDWQKVKTSLVELYGPAKVSTVGRWVRAAKGMSQEVIESLKTYEDLKGNFLWDNAYIVASPSHTRSQLTPQYAIKALDTLRERMSSEPLSSQTFQEKICVPMKIVEVWRALMIKRYGSVASNSPALDRLVDSLTSWVGLQSVSRCAQSGVVLHGVSSEQQGIPECWLLKNEFDKCLAGGLPPPARIPTEQEMRKQEDERKKALEEQRQAEEERSKKEQEDQRIALEEARTSSLTEEVDLVMLTTPKGGTGVSAVPPEEDELAKAAREKNKRVASLLQEAVGRVHFCDSPDKLLSESKDALQKAARAFVVVEAPTTSVSAFSNLLEVAKSVSDLYVAGSGNGGNDNQSKIRIVVLVGRRHDLIAKIEDRGAVLWPQWYQMVVQLKKRDTQSHRVKPGYAVVITPVQDVAHEPISLALPRVNTKNAAAQCLNLRCTEANCPYRPKALNAIESSKVGENDEIEAEDRINILDSMMDEAQEADEGPQSQEAGVDADADDMEVEAKKLDCVVNLWPFAHTTQYYQEVLCSLASADKASVCYILSTTAHPSHWVTCGSSFGLDTYLLTRRWSSHSAQHGRNLGTQLLKAMIQEEVGGASVSAAPSKREVQCISGVVVMQPQVIEAYDVSQGMCWHDGLNRSIPVDVLGTHTTDLIRREAEANLLRITGVQTNKGRGLETLTAKRDGDIICGASALFWDEWERLLEFVKLPGNARFGDRIVQIDNVKRCGLDVTIWAVLVGVCQFVQHYEGYRPRANCILEFDASKGFNNGVAGAGLAGVSAAALKLKVVTRNGAGISAGSPLLLNYGVSFDLSAGASGAEGVEFRGALDALFEAQRAGLPAEAEANTALALQERQAVAERAAAEGMQKEQEEQDRKRKLEEEAKHQEEEAKRRKLEDDEQKRVARAVAEEVKPSLDAVVNELQAPKASFGHRGDKLFLVSLDATNKKIPKDTVIMTWTNEVGVKADECSAQEWDINLKSDILWKDNMKRYKLDKLLKELCPAVGDIWKCVPFPAGALPKVLVKKEPQKRYGFISKAAEKDLHYKIIKLARSCTSVSVMWILKATPAAKAEKLEPCGLAIVTNKQMVLPGSGELCLE